MDNVTHSATGQKQALKNLLGKEIQCAGELLALFNIEKHALATLDNEQILLHARKKEEMIGKLQSTTLSRMSLMKDLDLADVQATATGSDDPELADLFTTLNKLATSCVSENRNIGHLIHRRSQLIEAMIDGMRGPAAGDLTYSAGGTRLLASRHQNYARI